MDALHRAAEYFHQALAQQQAGRLEDAARLYREALSLAPDRPSVLINLAGVLIRQQAFAEALRLSERVLELQPGHPDALQNAALCRHQLHGSGDTVALLRQAVAARPEDVEALSNLALALRETGDDEGALALLDRALALEPQLTGARANRAALRAARGRLAEAQQDYLAVLAASPESATAQRGFFEMCCVPGFVPAPDDTAFRTALLQALRAPWGRPQTLAPLCLRLLRSDPALAADLARGTVDADAMSAASRALLLALLPRALLADPAFEAWWTRLRDALVVRVATQSDATQDGDEFKWLCALAAQAFFCEYLPPAEEAARAAAEDLAQRLAARLAATQDEVPAVWVAAIASIAPLAVCAAAEAIARRRWPDQVQALVEEQLRAAYEEANLRARMPSLTPISDATSREVRAQYETNPYPRWSGLHRAGEPQGLAAFLAARLPEVPRQTWPGAPLRVLVAGCGTGQQPIETAQSIAGADVLAIDLSLASLAYAQRRARAMGVTNLRFAQADLLQLGNRGMQFDLIECSGVLHHLAEPQRGLAVLASVLRDGGWMRLALYSERGRRSVVAARARIAACGWTADLAGMQACRADLLRLPGNHPARGVLAFNDFYAASPCRDLLFHVQEHRFTLPALAVLLEQQRLAFCGFELPAAVHAAFAAAHPLPGAQRDLSTWDRFEQQNPDTFASMYQFWVRKAG